MMCRVNLILTSSEHWDNTRFSCGIEVLKNMLVSMYPGGLIKRGMVIEIRHDWSLGMLVFTPVSAVAGQIFIVQ